MTIINIAFVENVDPPKTDTFDATSLRSKEVSTNRFPWRDVGPSPAQFVDTAWTPEIISSLYDAGVHFAAGIRFV